MSFLTFLLTDIPSWFNSTASAMDWTAVITAIVSAIGGIVTALLAVKKDWLKLQNRLNLSASEILADQNVMFTDNMAERLKQLEDERDGLVSAVAKARLEATMRSREKLTQRSVSTNARIKLKKLLKGEVVTPDDIEKVKMVLDLWESLDAGVMGNIYDQLLDN